MDKKIIQSVFEHVVAQYPTHVAIECNHTEVTYQHLNQQANQLAHTLRAQGISRDCIVGLFLPAGIDYIVSLLAVIKAGGVFLPLDTASPKKRLEYLLNKAKPSLIITEAMLATELTQQLTEFDLNNLIRTLLLSDAQHAEKDNPALISSGEDSLYLLFTSGSTGNPKAIVGRQKSLSHFIHWELKEFAFDSQVRVSLLAAPTFDVSLRDIFVPLLSGGTLCIPRAETRTNIPQLLAWLEQNRVTTVHCVPSLFRLFSKELENAPEPQRALPALKTVLLAGEPVYGSLVNQWFALMGERVNLVNLYGPSETTLAKLFHRIAYHTYEPHNILPLGQPISNTAVLLFHEGQLCGIGESGEIHIKTPFISKGYYQDEALTAASFIQNPLNECTDIIYKTGDLGRYLADRSVAFLGRLDNQVKFNGIRIELGEIEQAVLRHEKINQAVAMVFQDTPENQVLACYYTTKQALSSDELRRHLQNYLADNIIPPFLLELDNFKLNSHGKIDRKALPKPEAVLHERLSFQTPRNAAEEKLAVIWREVLNLAQVGIDNAFIDLGGDSLKAIRVVAKIYQAFEVEITLKNYFKYPTIAQLAKFIETQQKTTYQAIPNCAKQDSYAVSHAQKRLWTLQQMDMDARAYNLPSAYLFHGDYDVQALQGAFQQLVDRHDSLRTCFISVDGMVRQQIVQVLRFKLTFIDARHEAAQSAFIQHHIAQNRLQPFDLTHAPLMRASMLRIADAEYLMIFNIHHIICDVWSLNILMQELLLCYQGIVQNKIADLAPLAIQYKDYATWQNRLLQDDSSQAHQQYWLQKLSAPLPKLDLPTDFPRPSVQTFKGNTLHFRLNATLTAALNALSQRHQVSLFMTLLAVVRVLLYRYTGEEDIIIGSPIAGRQHPDLEQQVGFYVNMLALRDSATGSDRFIDVLQRVQHTTLEAYDHQFYPFDRLVDELQLARDMSRSPLFDVMVMLQNVDVAKVNLEAQHITPYGEERDSDVSRFDWVIHFTERADELMLDFNYNVALFTAERIHRAFIHLEQLIQSICSDAEQPIHTLSLLTEQERQQVLIGFNQRANPYPTDKTLAELFAQQAAQHPDHPAVMLNGQAWSYQEINLAANRVAHQLRQQYAVSTHAIVGVSVSRSESLIIALLGVLKAGGVYLPIDPNYPAARITHMLNNSACQLVLADQAHVEVMQAYEAVTVLEISALTQQGETDNPTQNNTLDDTAFLIYTSGSTGKPKGVMMPQRGFINMIFDQIQHFAITPTDHFLQFASASFDAALYESFIAFLGGATLVLIDKSTIDNTAEFVDYLAQHAVTNVVLPPVYLRALQQHPLPSVRTIMTVGEAAIVEDALFYAQSKQYFNGYGPTEGSICVSVHQVQPRQIYPNGLPVGRPTANTALYVLDEKQAPVPVGILGEICVAGIAVTQGYLNNAPQTEASFIANPFQPNQRLYKTGDLGRWLANGELEFMGRKDSQVKVSGHRIEPSEIALSLRQHTAIQDAMVFAHGQATGDKTLVAYFTTAAETCAPNPTELRAFLHQHLPAYMVPAYFVALAHLPLTPNGKIDKAALPSLETIKAQQADDYVAPQTASEQLLAEAWAQFLAKAKTQISIHDNYFSLGGDSIKAIQIAAYLRQAGYRLEVHDIFQYPTIAQLALEIMPLQQQIAQEAMTGDVALTPIQHWFFTQQLPEPWHFNQSILLHVPAQLDPDALKRAFAAVLSHHDALRLRFQCVDGDWQQTVGAVTEAIPFHLEDLSASADVATALTQVTLQYQQSLKLAEGVLTQLVLLTWQGQARVFWCIHHLVVDGVSWRILAEDLQTAYQQIVRQRDVQLPLKTSSYKAWSARLADYARSEALATERAYWQAVPVVALPVDQAQGENRLEHTQTHTLTLSAEDTEALLTQVPIAYNTRINDVLLTALALTLNQWTGESQCVVDLEGHGRVALFKELDLSRTVGWFTSVHPVALNLAAGTALGAALKAVKEQLRAVPHDGIGHGLLSQLGERLPKGEILFNYLGQFDAASEAAEFRIATEKTGHDVSFKGQRDHLIDINGAITQGQLSLSWRYSQQCYHAATIQGLTRGYQQHLRDLIAHCQRGKQGVTPSDFPLATLTQARLDALYCQYDGLQDLYPLSPMQQGMLFHALYEPETGTYFEQMQCTLSRLDPSVFKAVWQHQLERHTLFRSAFLIDQHPMLQCVQANVPLIWREHDWRTHSSDQQQSKLHALLQQERAQGFDLTQAPLMRFDLIRLDEQRYVFVQHFHHTLMDGWCLSITLREVQASYLAFKHGKTPRLPSLRPYRDYIAWLQQQDNTAAQQYWQQRLAGFTAPTALPILGHPTERAAYQEKQYFLSGAQSQRLQQFSQTQGITLNTLIQGAWALLLSRYSRETSVCFGVTVSGRQAALSGIEHMMGLFINTLPLYVHVQADTVKAYLLALQTQHQDDTYYAYTPLFEIQRLSEVPNGIPLFDSLLVFENYPSESTLDDTPDSFQVEDFKVTEYTNYALTIAIVPGESFRFKIGYDSQRIPQAVIESLWAHLTLLLMALVENPAQALSQLTMLTAAEAEQLQAWNDTETDYPRDETIVTVFEQQVRRTPNRIALVFQDQQLTYRELNQKANQVAHVLRSQHQVKADTLVGICVERSLEMVIGLLGILKAGGAYIPMDPNYPAERLAWMLEDSQVSVLLTQSQLQNRLPAHQAAVRCLDKRAQFAKASVKNLGLALSPENLAYVLFTSGSTGRPKGVMIEHRAIFNHMAWMQDRFNFTLNDRVLQKTPISFDASVWEFYAPLLNGATLVLAKPQQHFDIQYLAHLLHQEKITVVQLVPSLLEAILDIAQEAPSSLRYLFCGGETLSIALQQKFARQQWQVPLYNLYGPTEACIDASYWLSSAAANMTRIGRPIANTRIYILDEQHQPQPPQIAGELCIAGAGLARGYLNRPDLSAEKFIELELFGKTERVYKTGDLARWLPDGNLEYLGRIDHQVKLRGYRIELGEIEATLVQQDTVNAAAVIVHEQAGNAVLAAYLVGKYDNLDIAPLREVLKTCLPDYMIPSHFMVLDKLPLTPNGKIDRKALPAPETVARHTSVLPRDTFELHLLGIWETVLNVHPISIHDNFFDLGGHSLLALKLMSHIQQQCGVRLPVSALFQSPTIAALAQQLHTDAQALRSNLVPIQTNAHGNPIYCLPGAIGSVMYLYPLASCLARPVYALQTPGLDGSPTPATIEALAQYHLKALQAHQPTGPYYLLGHSSGARVAFEMAWQLEQQGETIAFLGILDASAPKLERIELSELQWLSMIGHVFQELAGVALPCAITTLHALPDLETAYQHILHAFIEQDILYAPNTPVDELKALVNTYRTTVQAHCRYQTTGKLKAAIHLFRATTRATSLEGFEIGEDQRPARGWAVHTAAEVIAHKVSGTHYTIMMPPHVEVLAAAINADIQNVST